MTNINLSKKQKDKLIEMCKALFPEYHYVGWYITEDELSYRTKEFRFNLLHFIKNGNEGSMIHWFEFCMTHLLAKLADSITDLYNYEGLSLSEHPVDYLYQEFKKLK